MKIKKITLSPESEASREVANLTEKKIHIPPYMVWKNLSVCLSVTKFNPYYLRTGYIFVCKFQILKIINEIKLLWYIFENYQHIKAGRHLFRVFLHFSFFFSLWWKEMLKRKKMISTSEWHAKHQFAGGSTQHSFIWWNRWHISECNEKPFGINMSVYSISEDSQTYHTHTSCYYCLDLTLC